MNPLVAFLPAFFAAAMAAPEAQVLHPNLLARAGVPAAVGVAGVAPVATVAHATPVLNAHVNEGVASGPLTPLFGGAVQTPRGLADIALEGFSEDLDQDGFVDPIAPAALHAAPVAVAAAPLAAAPVAATPLAAAPAHGFAGFPTLNSAFAP